LPLPSGYSFYPLLWALYLQAIQLGPRTVLEPQKYALSTVCALLYSNPAPSMVYINTPKAPVAKAGYHTSNSTYLKSFICTSLQTAHFPSGFRLTCTSFLLFHMISKHLALLTFNLVILQERRSQWPRGLRRGSAAARQLRLWVRIPPGAWMSVSCECCVLSGRGHCDELITRPEESYRLRCVVVCDPETS